MGYPAIAGHRLSRLLHEVRDLPEARRGVRFPEWYLRQWHFHPDGYLSRAAIRRYELLIERLYNAGRRRLVDRSVVDATLSPSPHTVVEVGCGTGRLLAALVRALPGATVTGVDLSPHMLQRARDRCRDAPGLRLLHADVTTDQRLLPTAEVVVAVHVLGHTPRETAASIMASASAMAGDDGRVITVDHRWHRPPVLPPGLALWRRRRLLGGLLVLREYRKSGRR